MEKDLCACYSRVSSTEQSLSCEHQQQILEDWCKQHNYIPIQYSDNGISGTGFKQRKQFLKMLEDINIYWTPQYETFYINNTKDLKFNRIVCKSSSRFGRSLDCIKIIQLINRQNVELIFLEDGESGVDMLDPNSNLITSINATINQHFSIQNSQRVKHGMRQSSLNGQVLTSNSIYGYNYNAQTKQLEIIEEQAKVIRIIFDKYCNENLGYKAISNYINSLGYKTKRQNRFEPSLVAYILQNEKYAGLNVRGKYSKSKLKGDKHAKLNNKKDWIITENIPAIIDYDLFLKAQTIRDSKKSANRGCYKGKTLLSGKVICMQCGYRMNLNYYYNKDHDKIYYLQCWGKHQHSIKFCDNRNVYIHNLQKLIDSTFINSLIFRNRQLRLDSINTTIKNYTNKLTANNENEVRDIQNRINKLTTNKSKLLDLLLQGSINDKDYTFKSNEIDKELQELNVQLVQLTTGKEELQNKLFKLKQLQKQVKSIQINGEYTWEEICNLIQTIKVYKDKLIVTIDINGIVFTEELIY